MCGIVGMISRKEGGFYHSDLELMQNLLYLDQIRGEDSTGVFTVFRDKSVSITKVGSHPAHLFITKEWEKHRAKSISQGRIMIGHNRKATMGVVNSANAHPFHENNIVLVHNGTLRGGHKKLADTEVDSHAVCHAFNEKGAINVIPTLDAAFAFVWWDIEKSKLFAVRNDERPLSLVVTEDLNILCSEPWMAVGLLARANKKVETVIAIEAGTIYEFDINGTFKTSKVELKKFATTVVHYTNGPINRTRYAGEAAWEDDLDDGGVGTGDPKSVRKHGTEVPTILTPFSEAANSLVTSANYTKHKDYNAGDAVLVRITSIQIVPSQASAKVTGIVIEPGKEAMDFVGYLDPSVGFQEREAFRGKDCIAQVTGVSNSVCGPSMWVRDIKIAPTVKMHSTNVPVRVWNYVCAYVSCTSCNKHVHCVDAQFTSVSKRSGGWRVTCADCIEEKLSGEMKDEFTQRRIDALQDGEPVEQTTPRGTLSLVKTDGTPTLH